jgi:methionyl-tRNA synthetase
MDGDACLGTVGRGSARLVRYPAPRPPTADAADGGGGGGGFSFSTVERFAVTWLPILFFAALVTLIAMTLRLMPRTKPQQIKPQSDSSISWEDIAARYQAELANGLGNLASRVSAMVGKYFDGVLPEPGGATEAEEALAGVAERAVVAADAAVDRVAPHEALNAVWTLVDAVNGYSTEQPPWAVAKDEAQRERLATILYASAEALRVLAVLLNPAMPKACARIWEALGAEESLGTLDRQPVRDAGRWGQLVPGAAVTKGAALFPRLDA